MKNSFKTVLLWLLLLAVPLQGFAASSMLFCKPARHHPAVSQMVHHDHAAHHGKHADHDNMVNSIDRHHVASALNANIDHGNGTIDSDHDMSKCSTCAACCIGVMMAPSVASLIVPKVNESERIPFVAFHLTWHIPAGLERPPHSSLI